MSDKMEKYDKMMYSLLKYAFKYLNENTFFLNKTRRLYIFMIIFKYLYFLLDKCRIPLAFGGPCKCYNDQIDLWPLLKKCSLQLFDQSMTCIIEYIQKNFMKNILETVFKWGIDQGEIHIVCFLIEHFDIDPSCDDNYAIRYASRRGDSYACNSRDPSKKMKYENDKYTSLVELLLNMKNVDASAYYNEALRSAFYFNHLDIVNILIRDNRVLYELQYDRGEEKYCRSFDVDYNNYGLYLNNYQRYKTDILEKYKNTSVVSN